MASDPASPRYARQRALDGIGTDGQARLAEAHVVVIGAGGLGSALLPTLAAAGIGRITIIDDVTVQSTSLPRQTLYSPADVGRPKAEAAAAALAVLTPDAEFLPVVGRFAEGTTPAPLDLVLDADVLVDASDDPTTRFLANDIAAVRDIPLVWGSALGWHGQAGVAWDEAGVDYRDLAAAPVADAADRANVGALPSVCTVIGGVMAGEVVKLLTGTGEPLVGRVALFDARSSRVRELRYTRDAGAVRPGSIEERTKEPEMTESQSLDALELAALLDSPEPPLLVDVREAHEHAFVSIPGSILIPLRDVAARSVELDQDADIVLYCHHGARSGQALEMLRTLGFANVRHLAGGIDAFARIADPELPRY